MFKKVIVLEIISDSSFYTDDNIQDLMNYYGVKNSFYLNCNGIPPNTIIAIDANKKDLEAHLYFPFFSHTQKPIKVGEWAWALSKWNTLGIENELNYSYWLSRVVGPAVIEDSNYTHNDKQYLGKLDLNHLLNGHQYYTKGTDKKKFELDESLSLDLFGDDKNEYEEIINSSIAENFFQREPIPKIVARPGEHLIEGSNNSYILLGSDRTISKVNAKLEDTKNLNFFKTKLGTQLGLKSLTSNIDLNPISKKILVFSKIKEEEIGCIDIVAGKIQKKYFKKTELKSENNKKTLWNERDKFSNNEDDKIDYFNNIDKLNFEDDRSRVFISQKTNLSENFNINFDSDFNQKSAGICLKSDNILNISRKKIGLIFQENFNSTEENCSYMFLNKEIKLKSSKLSNILITNESSKFEIKDDKIKIGNKNVELIDTIYKSIKLLVDNASSLTLSPIGPTSLNPTILTELQKLLSDLKKIGDV